MVPKWLPNGSQMARNSQDGSQMAPNGNKIIPNALLGTIWAANGLASGPEQPPLFQGWLFRPPLGGLGHSGQKNLAKIVQNL